MVSLIKGPYHKSGIRLITVSDLGDRGRMVLSNFSDKRDFSRGYFYRQDWHRRGILIHVQQIPDAIMEKAETNLLTIRKYPQWQA